MTSKTVEAVNYEASEIEAIAGKTFTHLSCNNEYHFQVGILYRSFAAYPIRWHILRLHE